MNSHSTVTQLRPATMPPSLGPLFEAILFDAGKPLSPERLAQIAGVSTQVAVHAVEQLAANLEDAERGLCLVRAGATVQIAAKPVYGQALELSRRSDQDRMTALVDEFLHSQSSAGRRPGTLLAYEQFLKRFVREVGKPADEILTRDIRLFLMSEERQRGNSRNTLATKTAILRSYFAWLEKEDLVERDPMRKIDKPKTESPAPKFLSHEELELVREACGNLLERCLVEVLYGSGLRVSEAVALDWSDIDWQEKTITVREGKGGKSRVVPMGTKEALLLRRLQEERQDNEPWVFRSQYKQRMSKTTIEWRFRQLGKLASLSSRLTPHRLRHSLATHLLGAGCPIDVVQSILGHSDISTTQIYARTQRSTVENWYRKVMA